MSAPDPGALTRSQDEIVSRCRQRMADPADEEMRHIALANALDREHALQLIDPTQTNPADFPVVAPSRAGMLADLCSTNVSMLGVNLPGLLDRIRRTRTQFEQLAEYAWILGHDAASAEMVPPDGHAGWARDAMVGLVRFARAFRIPLPDEGTEQGMPADLTEAAAIVDAERSGR